MAWPNLWYVTHSLTTLIKAAVEASKASGNLAVTVSARPPDQLKGSSNTLGLYLYHIAENTQYKNRPPPGSDVPPVRYTPMGLDLFYQLTAHGEQSEAGIEQAHLMMGLAVKSLRDYPVIDESTKVVNTKIQPNKITKVLDSNLKDSGTRLKITLQPLPHNEAVSFWTAGSSPLQVAAYYQVYVVLLDPEESQTRAGRVLTYGTYADVSGTPHLNGTRNSIEFTDPRGSKNEIELRPAQAAPAPAGSVSIESQVKFSGSNLIGDKTTLILKNSLWDEPVNVKDTSWSIKARDNQVTATIREDVGGKKVLPGIYAAMLKVSSERELPDGSKRAFNFTSNETPFVVSPRIDTITGPDTQNLVKVNGFIFKYLVNSKNVITVQVYVGDVRLRPGKTVANLNQGEFGIHEPLPPQAPQLHLRLPKSEDLPPPLAYGGNNYLPLRVFINGAESLPKWIKV